MGESFGAPYANVSYAPDPRIPKIFNKQCCQVLKRLLHLLDKQLPLFDENRPLFLIFAKFHYFPATFPLFLAFSVH
jgi:hypothetical protein